MGLKTEVDKVCHLKDNGEKQRVNFVNFVALSHKPREQKNRFLSFAF